MKIVADTTNGTAGLILPELFKKFPSQLIHIFSELDGSFPSHGPNPLKPENTKALQERVLSEKADLGIAFDGDGDRIVFVDEKGERIQPDLITALLVNRFFMEKDVKDGIKPMIDLDKFNSYLSNIIDNRLLKLLKLSKAELTLDDEKRLTISELTLYRLIFDLLSTWKTFFLK